MKCSIPNVSTVLIKFTEQIQGLGAYSRCCMLKLLTSNMDLSDLIF